MAFCELSLVTSNIDVYIFNINICIYIDMGWVSVHLCNYILLMNQSSQSSDAQVPLYKRKQVFKNILFHLAWVLLISKN